LTASGRLNHSAVSSTIDGKAKESFTYNRFNPSIGISHAYNPAINFFGNFGQSNRVPTVIELGCADPADPCRLPTGLQADPHLKQIIGTTLEGGVRVKLSSGSGFGVSVYRTENKNDILFRATGTAGLGYFDNFSRTRRQGADITAYTDINSVALRVTYSYLDATYQDDGTLFGGERDISVTPGTKIAGLPEHTVRINADWRATPKMTIGGSVVATSSITTQGNEDGLVGDGTTTTEVNAKVKGYTLLNLHANYEASKGLDYFARINNVFDTRHETYGMMAMSALSASGSLETPATVNRFVAPGAPRNLMIGLRYRF